MTKTLYDPEVEKRGIEQGKFEVAKRMLTKGLNVEDIVELTGLTIQEVETLKKDRY